MTEYLFRIKNGNALLIQGDTAPVNQAVLRLEDGREGTALIGGKRIKITGKGAALDAQNFKSGLHSLLILADGMRFEGPQIAVFGNTLCFLPPSHQRLAQAEERIAATEEKNAELEKRLAAIEHRMQNTNIF